MNKIIRIFKNIFPIAAEGVIPWVLVCFCWLELCFAYPCWRGCSSPIFLPSRSSITNLRCLSFQALMSLYSSKRIIPLPLPAKRRTALMQRNNPNRKISPGRLDLNRGVLALPWPDNTTVPATKHIAGIYPAKPNDSPEALVQCRNTSFSLPWKG